MKVLLFAYCAGLGNGLISWLSGGGLLLKDGVQPSLQIVPWEDALLIAVAPDLLDSLKNMVRIFDRGLMEGTIGYNACMEAKEAIKKATT
jgi:hypothetical protein